MPKLNYRTSKQRISDEVVEKRIKMPFFGLFDNFVRSEILEEIICDVYGEYTPEYFSELTMAPVEDIKKELDGLCEAKILVRKEGKDGSVFYTVDPTSKIPLALELLEQAIIDDMFGSNVFYMHITRCSDRLREHYSGD